MELSHTLEVEPNLYIRTFVRFYDMSRPYDLNTCKLFWGTIGLIIIPAILLVLSPIIAVLLGARWMLTRLDMWLKSKAYERKADYAALPLEERVARQSKKSWRSELLDKLSMWGSAFWFKAQMPLTWLFRITVGLVVLVGFIALIIWAVSVAPGLPWHDILSLAALVAGAFIAGGLVLLGIVLAAYPIVRLLDRSKRKKTKKPSMIKAMFRSVHDHTCANIKVIEK